MNVTIRGFLKKELSQALRDKRMKILLFLMPVIQLTIFGLALENEVRNIRLAVFYRPEDTMSRRLAQKCYASGWFVKPKIGGEDPYELIEAGHADAVLVAPKEGSAKAIENGRAGLQLLIDATNAIRARSIEAYVQSIAADLQKEEARGSPIEPRVGIDVRVLYNPSARTALFLVPGVMVMVLALLTIVLTSMSMAREREVGTLEMLIATPIAKWEILLGKTVPYVLIAMADVPLILLAGGLLFGVPVRGSIAVLLLAAFCFVCTTVSIGTLISTFSRNQQQAMMGGFIFMMPNILLSGIMYPVENMPRQISWICTLDPLWHFVTLIRNIMLKGGDAWVVSSHVAALAGLAAVSIVASARRFHSTLN
ncbi:MAG: ABC transporter permease [Elusimicrobia bacterium]|nr:ABC transporter permease [Elusimicrobiota bacterium]